jgi:hypothetical protein
MATDAAKSVFCRSTWPSSTPSGAVRHPGTIRQGSPLGQLHHSEIGCNCRREKTCVGISESMSKDCYWMKGMHMRRVKQMSMVLSADHIIAAHASPIALAIGA